MRKLVEPKIGNVSIYAPHESRPEGMRGFRVHLYGPCAAFNATTLDETVARAAGRAE